VGQLVLVLGGVRSGKSRFAEQLAATSPPVTYLATAQAGDAEMARRIARHQERRDRYDPPWRTVEEPWEVVRAARSAHGSGAELAQGCVLLECLPLWLTNLLVGLPGRPGLADEAVLAEVRALAGAAAAAAGRTVVVSSEVGCGLMPANALARRFGDLLGEANQILASAAAEVYACLAGIPLRVK
jgi:adenosylcobinamide kinase/adenosylcobinamide-phosphate guanylyltransferase